MKPRNIVWTTLTVLALAVYCSFFLVDKFKIANGQFHRDATHTYSERICTGSSGSGSRVCTNYFFTDEQHSLNIKLDQIYKVLILLAGIILFFYKIFNPEPKDKMQNDPIGTIQTGWKGLMEENEKQRKDPNHGWTSSGKRTFLFLLFLLICFAILSAFIESSHIFEKLLKIN